jgi:hypothetical protein
MSENYRGWHYHITHKTLTQNQIFDYLSIELKRLGASQEESRECVDYLEYYPNRGDTKMRQELTELNRKLNSLYHIGKHNDEQAINLRRKVNDVNREYNLKLSLPYLLWEQPSVSIGTIESNPERMEVWRLGEDSTVLWISSVTHTLHVEANKSEEFAKSILTKPILVKILKSNEPKIHKPTSINQ